MFILPDGRRVEGSGWTEVDGVQHPLWRMSENELAALSVTRVLEPAAFNAAFYNVNSTGHLQEKSLEEAKQNLKDLVSSERWTREQQGVAFGDHVAQTDRESRANYVGLALAAQLGRRTEGGVYKFKTGAAPLANSDVIPLAVAVAEYVQGLFNKEAEIFEQSDKISDLDAAKNFAWKFK